MLLVYRVSVSLPHSMKAFVRYRNPEWIFEVGKACSYFSAVHFFLDEMYQTDWIICGSHTYLYSYLFIVLTPRFIYLEYIM